MTQQREQASNEDLEKMRIIELFQMTENRLADQNGVIRTHG